VEAIVQRAAGCSVLEIGPGVGVLTTPLCDACPEVVAVELDARFVDVLAIVAPCARVVREDALKADLGALLRGMDGPRCVVSNMPYNITGPLLGKIADARPLFRNAVLMMQKEVGQRIVAREKTPERGALSVAMQLQFDIEKVCDAKAGAFVPPPKVDSIVLDFVPKPETPGLAATLALVREGFRQPRKTLANNLAAHRGRLDVPARVRPHELSNEEWEDLASRL
jgi:16S rRNA (adenine1518-N6/adenine1519-N6)-dimethyltransferase